MMKSSRLAQLLIVGMFVLLRVPTAVARADTALLNVRSDRPPASMPPGTSKVVSKEQPTAHLWLARPFPAGERQWIEQGFPYGSDGGGRWRLHTGVDFPNPLGTPVLSVAAGRVVYAGDDSARRFGPELKYYGKLVIIKLAREYCQFAIPEWEHDGCDALPVFVLYAHLNQIFVKAGQSVLTGDLIGTVGMTGIASGPHLHLEVRLGREDAISATRNPALWMRPLEGYGIIAGRLLDAEGRPVRDDRLLVCRVDEDTQLWRVMRTYPEESFINSDAAWNENFVLPEVPAGEYLLVAGRGAGIVRRTVTVTSGRMSFAEVALSQETRTEAQREGSSAEARRAP